MPASAPTRTLRRRSTSASRALTIHCSQWRRRRRARWASSSPAAVGVPLRCPGARRRSSTPSSKAASSSARRRP
ncbi:MAG: hypothetical protein H6710_04375 [Myxococcales bacterium]|nr:hypothetical protein [Myxococcales bacterium]